MAKNKTIAFRTSDENRKMWEANGKKKGMNLTDYIHHCLIQAEKVDEEVLHLKTSLLFVLDTIKAIRVLEQQIEGVKVDPVKIKKIKDITFDTMYQGLNLVYKEGKLPKDIKSHLTPKLK